jgi:RimJ/RimL family protein N-acetyltransferase
MLRQWRESDLPALAALNADPEVMRHFPRPLTARESEEMLLRLKQSIEQHGWGLWAVDVDGTCAGFTGLAKPCFAAAFTPCVEVGWRLARAFWGQSIAFEAARKAISYASSDLALEELVSFTTVANVRSRRLMERLGFLRNPAEDFLHPSLAPDDPLRPHVLYRKRLQDEVA